MAVGPLSAADEWPSEGRSVPQPEKIKIVELEKIIYRQMLSKTRLRNNQYKTDKRINLGGGVIYVVSAV